MDTSKRKPDLMAGASAAPAHKRILAQLEHGARPAPHSARADGWTIDGWTISLFVLLLLMCCVAWVMHDKTVTHKTVRPSYSSRTAAPAIQTRVATPEQAATIVNMAPPDITDDEEIPTHAAASTAPSRAASGSQAAASSRAVAVQHKQPNAVGRATSQPAAGVNATPVASHAGDTDVALLTALVAHAGKPATVTPDRSRDVVERQDGDTTLQLLARCKQLGLIEGMLCRSRICSGRWESDAACRAPSH